VAIFFRGSIRSTISNLVITRYVFIDRILGPILYLATIALVYGITCITKRLNDEKPK
jgi:hypothetical protein